MRVLVDNDVLVPGLGAEHGLSLLFEWNGHAVLFDTGQSSLLMENARRMGVDLSRVEFVVLSHGHYDHGGGLAAFLDRYPHTRVIAHIDAYKRRWARGERPPARAIGIPSEQPPGFEAVSGVVTVCPGVTMLTDIPRHHPEGCGTRGFSLLPDRCEPDTVPDDSGLVFETKSGLVLVTGCCHAGIRNYLDLVAERWPHRPIVALIGGLHLRSAEDAELREAIDAIAEASVAAVGPLHCTGERGRAALDVSGQFRTEPLGAGADVRFRDGDMVVSLSPVDPQSC